MRIFFVLLLGGFGFMTFGQEKPSLAIEWESLNAQLSESYTQYTIEHQEIIPSLSYIRSIVSTGNYQLMEIDLTVDLRRQLIKDDRPMLLLPENKFVKSDYYVAIPTIEKSDASITITGNGGYNNSNPNNGGVKNTVYEDASTRTGIYCPVTGLPLTTSRRPN
ncbi:hypothetical protein [Aquimarina rubra]|uniref:Uncharacterized protein n=1 Tax=Aquimarina rubra TaxID=1920033 RepID=A0ABW5LCE5_9FLAO